MDMFGYMSEDEIMDYAVQLSIQESCQNASVKSQDSLEMATDENLKLLAAIKTGDVSVLRELLKVPFAFREVDSRGWLPLHRAAVQPMVKVLETVLRAYVPNLEEKTADGETPLTLAAQAGLVENVKTLLEHGASPYTTNSKTISPLLLAVRTGSYEMVYALIANGAMVDQVCANKWTVMHEAAKVGCSKIMMLLLRYEGSVTARDQHCETPLSIAAEYAHKEILELLISSGGSVNTQAFNGESVLMNAAGSSNPDCINLLLENGADPNQASMTGHLPIHRAAYEGRYLVLKILIQITKKKAIRCSSESPVHSAADGGHAQCLELLIQSGFDINSPLKRWASEKYSDMRKSALYFAVSNGDITCTEMLLNAGAKPDLDPLQCLLVAVRAGMYEIVKLLLAKQADVNCYFTVVSKTLFPTALQYCLKDEMMMRLLLNNGYNADSCFCCNHDDALDMTCPRKDMHKLVCQDGSDGDKVPFCEYMSLLCLIHLSGTVVRNLLDYVSHIPICSRLRQILENQKEWAEICDVLGNPRSLKHLCRLEIRRCMTMRRLGDPKIMDSFPPRLKKFLIYNEFDLYGQSTDLLM